MASPQRPKDRDGALSTLDVLIQTLNFAKGACGIPPAQVVFASASALLSMIRLHPTSRRQIATHTTQDTMANDRDYVELGRACGEVCQALDRGLKGKRLDELTQSVLGAVGQLTT